MATKLAEKREELAAKQKALAAIFEEAGLEIDLSKVKSLDGDTAAKAAEIRRRNDELTALGKEVDELAAVEKAAADTKALGDKLTTPAGDMKHPGGKDGPKPEAKSMGKLFVESEAFKGYKKGTGPADTLDIELKTLFETTNGWAPETVRTGRVVDFATRPIAVVDLVSQVTTTQNAVVYMEESTFTNNAAEVAEGGGASGYGEAALAYTEQSSPVRKIAVFIPVTDEQLEDVPAMQGRIDNRLRFMCSQRLDSQILVGDGTAPNLRGILNVVGIQTQAKGTDPTPDAVYKAIVKVRAVGFADPNAYVTHPNDWQDIRLLRTADGLYIWGSPADPGPERIWGIGVLQTTAITENTGLVGDFMNFLELAARRGIEVQISNSHSDYFIKGKVAIRADMRVALVVYRPAAFCQVTGI